MNPNRKTAIVVGVLYIIGTVSGVLSVVFTKSILDAPDYLAKTAANGSQIITGALFVFTMGLALAMVPVVIFPVLKKHNEVLALGYVVFRGALETVGYMATVISILLIVPLSRAAVQSGVTDAANFQALGDLLQKANEVSVTIGGIIFPLGALMLYSVLYQSKLIPRWISVWGLIAVLLFMATAFLDMFGLVGQMSVIQTVLALPIALQEMVMAVWLIVKGFNSSPVNFGSAQVAISQA